jgi:hypothetical protein
MKSGVGSNLRIVFFLISLLFVGLMIWRVHQANRVSRPRATYQQFLEFAGTGQIQDARIYPGYDSAEILVSLRNQVQTVPCDVPTADLAKVVKAMMDKGATVEFSSTRRFDPWTLWFNLAPFVLLLVAFIVLLRRRKATA